MDNHVHGFPDEVLQEWQDIVNLVVRIAGVRAGLITRLLDDDLEILIASNVRDNPFTPGDRGPIWGQYCEATITQGKKILVPDALKSEQWRNNPSLNYGLVSYLGFPIRLPGGKPFGSLCLVDDKANEYSPDLIDLMEKMRNLIESHLSLVEENRLQRLFASESPLRRILDNIPTAIGCSTLGPDLSVIYMNEQFRRTFGYTMGNMPTVNDFIDRMLPLDEEYRLAALQWWAATLEQARQRPGLAEPGEFRITCQDGSVLDVLVSASILDDMLLVSMVDITGRKRAEAELRQSEQRHRLLADNASDVIMTLDADGRITYVSPSVQKLRGFTSAEVMQQSMEEILAPEGAAFVRAALGRAAIAIQEGVALSGHRGDFRQICKDGSLVCTEVSTSIMYDPDGKFFGILTVSRDITERKHYERELRLAHDALSTANEALKEVNTQFIQLATTDSLTGLWNRRHIQEYMAGEMALAQRYGQPLSLLLFDIDNFKSINDGYGHHAGDHVMVELSQRLRQNLRLSDQPARWGGDEFVVVAPHCRGVDALALAEKLRALLETQPFSGAGVVTASFGVAELQAHETLEGWLKRADLALYEAKSAGRNLVRLAA